MSACHEFERRTLNHTTRPIARTFARLKAERKLAFIPFLAAGDPDLKTTRTLARELIAAGADLVEIGFPYSDPIADGPVIQAAYTRALNGKVRLGDIFAMIAQLSHDVRQQQEGAGREVPLLGMVSYSIIFRAGPAAFVQQAVTAGLSGLIVPDLPGDEAEEFASLTSAAGLDLVLLVAPTTPRERVTKIVANASGFIYCIAVTGITGVQTGEQSTAALDAGLQQLRELTSLPLCVGFGISRPEHVQRLFGRADGAIVGSAIVRHVEGLTSPATAGAAREALLALGRSLAEAAHTLP